MKVVLMKNIDKLGKTGDIKEVADGFARNFLIPNQIAKPATEKAQAEAQKILEEKAKKEEERLQLIQEFADRIDGKEILIKSKAKEGKLFGAIKAADIIKAIKEDPKIEINENNIKIKEPIKEIGEYSLKVELEHGLEADIKLIIEEE
ncbi:MAG: 50S ribosomal protein L9 [Candidatus Moranbacteria bacterium]|jgi:large subunit ribosomal protein L9|nr:50S ribosomal protein L9 [Candidatus Moranbacteria bacterium]